MKSDPPKYPARKSQQIARAERLQRELASIQDFWSRKVRGMKMLTEREIERYLRG